jgi:hypothetical protein
LIIKVDGKPNAIYIDVRGSEENLRTALQKLPAPVETRQMPEWTRLEYVELAPYLEARMTLRAMTDVSVVGVTDLLEDRLREWPRGDTTLSLSVLRGEDSREIIDLPPFVPETIGLYPTQLYETVSMLLLILVLLAYYPYRRHDGQLMVILMIGYAIHRFINESLRIEPVLGESGLTLSQWGSVVILAGAIGIELYLWRVMPSRWRSSSATAAS